MGASRLHEPTGEAFFAGYGVFGTFTSSFARGASGDRVFFSQWGGAVFGPSLTLGRWTHVAAVSAGSIVALYVDGVKFDEQQQTIATLAGDFFIGGIPGDAIRKLDGAVDEVTLYDRALTAQEVSVIYAAGAAGKCR